MTHDLPSCTRASSAATPLTSRIVIRMNGSAWRPSSPASLSIRSLSPITCDGCTSSSTRSGTRSGNSPFKVLLNEPCAAITVVIPIIPIPSAVVRAIVSAGRLKACDSAIPKSCAALALKLSLKAGQLSLRSRPTPQKNRALPKQRSPLSAVSKLLT